MNPREAEAFADALLPALNRMLAGFQAVVQGDATSASMKAARGDDTLPAVRLHYLAALGAACGVAGRMDAALAVMGESRQALDQFVMLIIQSARRDMLRDMHRSMPPPPTKRHIETVARSMGVNLDDEPEDDG
jgi:hypothetical protein